MFADYQSRRYRLGLRLEMNYQNRTDLDGEQLTIPALGPNWGRSKRDLVRLHAGPYLGIQIQGTFAVPISPKPEIKWGFSTGLDLEHSPFSQSGFHF